MLNIVWPIFIILSFSYAIFFGDINLLNSEIFKSTEDAINLSINLLGTICLWNGIMQVASKTSVIDKLTGFLKPIIRYLFPELRTKPKIQKEISMNMIANILGLGNAATPIGLRAMALLQEENENKDTVSDSMAMLIILNTASIQIIPTTVIAIRSSLGSNSPTQIIVPVWIATIIAAITGILITKLSIKKSKRKKE